MESLNLFESIILYHGTFLLKYESTNKRSCMLCNPALTLKYQYEIDVN